MGSPQLQVLDGRSPPASLGEVVGAGVEVQRCQAGEVREVLQTCLCEVRWP